MFWASLRPKHVEELLITNKSLIVASSWSHLYLLIKDARSFEYKVCNCGVSKDAVVLITRMNAVPVLKLLQ